jgi:hypothetical protein
VIKQIVFMVYLSLHVCGMPLGQYSDDPPEIDLTAVRFPRLRTLTLSQISLRVPLHAA